MVNLIDDFRSKIRRRAIRMEIGGFRPSTSPTASWFGRVAFGLPEESWPCSNERPMLAVCQINLTQLPFRPPRLDDLEFITVFVDVARLPTHQLVKTRFDSSPQADNGWGKNRHKLSYRCRLIRHILGRGEMGPVIKLRQA